MSNPVPPPPTPPTTLTLPLQQPSETLAKDCKEFYEKRLRLTHSVEHKWSSEATLPSLSPFSKLPNQIAQLRSELLSLAHLDNELFKNLLALNDKLEELKVSFCQKVYIHILHHLFVLEYQSACFVT